MDTNFPHPVAETVLPCSEPNTGDSVEWLYVSLDTPFAVLIVYLAYCNKSLSNDVNLASI